MIRPSLKLFEPSSSEDIFKHLAVFINVRTIQCGTKGSLSAIAGDRILDGKLFSLLIIRTMNL